MRDEKCLYLDPADQKDSFFLRATQPRLIDRRDGSVSPSEDTVSTITSDQVALS
jgi:hypothetical protein